VRAVLLTVVRVGADAVVLWLAGGRAALAYPVVAAFLVIEGVWSLAEGFLSPPEGRRPTEPLDEFEQAFAIAGKRLALVALVYHWTVLAVFAYRSMPDAGLSAASLGGFSLFVTGALLRGGAIALMGDRFKSWQVRRHRRGIETRGPYRLVRHPSYLGFLLIVVAVPLIFRQWWALPVAVLLVPLVVDRVRTEEHLLKSVYGGDYERYVVATPARLMPGIW
jgi:protein-S-isoprenylcysteine O-methyltransferase Ste14